MTTYTLTSITRLAPQDAFTCQFRREHSPPAYVTVNARELLNYTRFQQAVLRKGGIVYTTDIAEVGLTRERNRRWRKHLDTIMGAATTARPARRYIKK